MVVSCAVLIQLYELSDVNFITQGPDLLVEGISQLKALRLRYFAVVKDAASETAFKYAVGWVGTRGKLPWVRASSLEEIIELVKNKTVKYAFSFKTSVANVLHNENLFNTLVAVPTDRRDVGGWYYSSTVRVEFGRNIGKALSTLVLNQFSNQSRKVYGSSALNCGEVMGR